MNEITLNKLLDLGFKEDNKIIDNYELIIKSPYSLGFEIKNGDIITNWSVMLRDENQNVVNNLWIPDLKNMYEVYILIELFQREIIEL